MSNCSTYTSLDGGIQTRSHTLTSRFRHCDVFAIVSSCSGSRKRRERASRRAPVPAGEVHNLRSIFGIHADQRNTSRGNKDVVDNALCTLRLVLRLRVRYILVLRSTSGTAAGTPKGSALYLHTHPPTHRRAGTLVK